MNRTDEIVDLAAYRIERELQTVSTLRYGEADEPVVIAEVTKETLAQYHWLGIPVKDLVIDLRDDRPTDPEAC